MKILRPFNNSSYQSFLQWFDEACEDRGIRAIIPLNIPWELRLVVAKLRLSRRLPLVISSGEKLIVPCGGYPDSFAFPFAYTHEIIPVLWDTWPRYHSRLIASLKRHRVRLAFFTQRQVAKKVSEALPYVKCVWLPEGIKIDGYKKGKNLSERKIDLLELGRLMQRFHHAVEGISCCHLYKDPVDGLLFADFNALVEGLANAKITICFPRCDTHPEKANNIETLTQRYWECMLSRTVILGRCPEELKDLVGYDPVVSVDWTSPRKQVELMLENIGDYQQLVDRNFDVAQKYAPWDARMDAFLGEIQNIDG